MKKLLILLLFPILMFGQEFDFECITSTSTVTMSGELEDGNPSSAKSNLNSGKIIITSPPSFSHDYVQDNSGHEHTLIIRNSGYTDNFYYTDTFEPGNPSTLSKGNEIAMPHGSYTVYSEDNRGIGDISNHKPHVTNASFDVPTSGPVTLIATSPYVLITYLVNSSGYTDFKLSSETQQDISFLSTSLYFYIYAKEGTYKYEATLNGVTVTRSVVVSGGGYIELDPINDPEPEAAFGFNESNINGWFESDDSPGYYKYLVNGSQTKYGYESYDANTEHCYFYNWESTGDVVKEIITDQQIYLGHPSSSSKSLFNKIDIDNTGTISQEDNNILHQNLSDEWISRNTGTYKIVSEYISYHSDEVNENGHYLSTGYTDNNPDEKYLEIVDINEINIYIKNGNCYDGITSTLPTGDKIRNLMASTTSVNEHSTGLQINNYSHDNNTGIDREFIWLYRSNVYDSNDRCNSEINISLNHSQYELLKQTYTYNQGTENEYTYTNYNHTEQGIQIRYTFEKVNDLTLNYCN